MRTLADFLLAPVLAAAAAAALAFAPCARAEEREGAPAPPRGGATAPAPAPSAPPPASAIEARPAPPRVAPGGAAPSSAAPAVPAPPRRAQPPPSPYGGSAHGGPYSYGGPAAVPWGPWWYWDWGLAWGFEPGLPYPGHPYPYPYPGYPEDPYAYAPPPPAPSAVAARVEVFGTGTLEGSGYGGGVRFGVEGRTFGLAASLESLRAPDTYYPGDAGPLAPSRSFGMFTLHGTALLLGGPRPAVRAGLGLSALTWPDVGPDAGSSALGPDAALWVDVALAGPLHAEAQGHGSPYPAPHVEWTAGLAVHLGPAAITAGWRELSIWPGAAGHNTGRFAFAGPQVGLALRL